MSQIYKSLVSGPVPPAVPTQFNTQNGNAVPAANILIINGFDSTEDNSNGIVTKGGAAGNPPGTGASNEVDIVITNRIQNVGATNGAVNLDLVSFSLGATPASFTFEVRVTAFSALNSAAGGWSLFGAVRTDGAAATLVPSTDKIESKDAAINAADVNYVVSGNSFVVRVTGVAGVTDLNWSAVGLYTRVI